MKHRKHKSIMQLLEELRELPVIVEGINDKRALKKLGVRYIITLRKPMYVIAEELAKYKKVAVLTDLDKEGKSLYRKMKENLTRNGIQVNDEFRYFLFKETKLRQIEGLYKYLSNNFEEVLYE